MTTTRWNYKDERYEYWASPAEGKPETWIEDVDRTLDHRADFGFNDLQQALSDSENWSWTTLCKRWGYTKSYLNRQIDAMVRSDIKALGKTTEYYHTLKELEPNDPVRQSKKAQTELKKWEDYISTIKAKLRERPDETRQEKRERKQQEVRTQTIFQVLGIPLPK